MADSSYQSNPPASRISLSQAMFGLLGVTNVAMIVAGAYILSGGQTGRMETSYVERVTTAAEKRSSDMARELFASRNDLTGLVQAADRLSDPRQGVSFELAAKVEGRYKVLAASEASVVGQTPEGGLLDALRGQKPEAEIRLPAANEPGSFHSAYYTHTLTPPAVTTPVATTAPAAVPPPKRALRTIKRTVKKQVPTPAAPYTIKFGDTLYQISRDRYGDETMFYQIWVANKAVIGQDRSSLPVGATIQLPAGAGRTMDVEEDVVIYPSEAPVVIQGASHPQAATAEPTEVALRLTVPMATRQAALTNYRERTLMVGGLAAAGAGLSWWLGALMLNRRRRRELADQKAELLGLLGDRFAPQAQLLDKASLRSPWQVEHAAVTLAGHEPGGSFTDYRLYTDSRLGLFIGDATGWNTTALVDRGLANAFWRARAQDHQPPGQTMLEVNRLMVDYIAQGDHVTAFYAQVDLMSGAVSFASAAHTGAFVLGRRGALTMLNGRGMPLGVGKELFAERLEEGHVRLQEGESLLLFTDGLLKAENADGEFFGLERLEKCLRERPGCDADAVVATIRDAVFQFTGGPYLADESAIMVLRLVSPLVLYPKLVVEPVAPQPVAEPEAPKTALDTRT